jgi:hypothetical protein
LTWAAGGAIVARGGSRRHGLAAAKGLLKFLGSEIVSFDVPGTTDTRALGISSAPLCDPGTVENLRLRFVIRDHGRALEVMGSGAVVVSGMATRDLDANECP